MTTDELIGMEKLPVHIHFEINLKTNVYRRAYGKVISLQSTRAEELMQEPEAGIHRSYQLDQEIRATDIAYLLLLPAKVKLSSVDVRVNRGKLKWAPRLQDGYKLWVGHPGHYHHHRFELVNYGLFDISYMLEQWEDRVRRVWYGNSD